MSSFPLEASSRIIDSREERRLSLPAAAAILSLVAAVVHAWVVRSHVTHWWAYGAFFAGLAIVQAAYAVVVTRRPSRRVAAAGVAGNAAVLGLYVWSRTVGVPMGPHSGKAESIGVPDLVAAAAELALIVALGLIYRNRSGDRSRRAGRASMAAILVALAAAGAVGPAGHAHPSFTPSLLLADGPEQWLGPPPPVPTPEQPAEPVVETTEPETIPTVEAEPPCGVQVADDVSAPAPAGPGEARAVAFTAQEDVWIYVPATNKAKRLTQNPKECWAGRTSWRNATYLSFTSGDTIHGLDLSSGKVETLLTTKHGVMSMDWSPDGKTLAYLTSWSGEDGNGGPQVVLYRPASDASEVIRTLPQLPGRCGSEDDEIAVTWAPDGHALIVVNTASIDEKHTMYVMDPDGHDLVPARAGTIARWAPDSRRIYYRDFDGDRKWHTLNSETGDTGTLGTMKPGTFDLAVSPDGSLLAYHDGLDDVGTYIFDVATKTQRKVADDAVMAVWLGPRTILVTDTKPCGDECFHSAWTQKGTTSVVDVVTKERTPATAAPTWDADAWVEPLPEADPSPAPPPSETPTPSPSPSDEPTPEPSSTSSPSPSPDPSPTQT